MRKSNEENEIEDENDDEELEGISNEEFVKIRRFWILVTLILLVFAIIITFFLSSTYAYYLIIKDAGYETLYSETESVLADTDSEETVSASDAVEEITSLINTFATFIDEKYVGEINKTDLINSTIKGFIDGIGDEYSEYMTAEEWEDYQASALGNYVGVGIYMSEDSDGNIIVIQAIDGTPAQEAGIEAEDIITAVDGTSTSGMSSTEVSTAIKGEAGTDVTITVYRNGEYLDFTLTRQEIKLYHVEYEMKEDNIGYIELLTFDEGCSEEFESAMDDLVSQGATKIIFDLRYNTGGLVDEALAIIDLFVDEGTTELIQVEADDSEKVTTSSNGKKYDVEVVLLINEYSASASEIVAGALIDNGVAISVGTTTYGKGVIQNVYSLATGGVLKLTTAEYYTPNKNKINKVGITPDYEVELETTTNEDGEETVVDTQLNKALELLK